MRKIYLEDDGIVKGFLAINEKGDLPHLQHFFIDKSYRNADNTRKLIKMFVDFVRREGFDKAWIHACSKRQVKLIQYYFKDKRCKVKDGIAWFLVGV